MNAVNLPRPAWMTEDLVLLEEQARRFIADEFVPHIDRWHAAGIYEREVWTKAGQAGLLCAAMPECSGAPKVSKPASDNSRLITASWAKLPPAPP